MTSGLFIDHEHGVFDLAVLFEVFLHVFHGGVGREAADEDLLGTRHHLNQQRRDESEKKEWAIAPTHAHTLFIRGFTDLVRRCLFIIVICLLLLCAL